jgi:hypothetical protein
MDSYITAKIILWRTVLLGKLTAAHQFKKFAFYRIIISLLSEQNNAEN